MSPAQLKMIHVAKRQACLTDDAYRTILRTVGGVESSKDLTQGTFEEVMAILEETHGQGTYWRDRSRGFFANPRMVHKIGELFAQYQELTAHEDPARTYKLPDLAARISELFGLPRAQLF
jgi:hypothetical protein